MEQISTIRDLIDAWPSRKEFAADMGVSVERVQKWAQLGTIRPRFWARIIRHGLVRAIPVTADDLVRMHDEGDAPESERAA